MPTARGDLGASVVGGRLVAVGGEGPTEVFPRADSFDIDKGQWSSLPPMRTPRHGLAVATVGTSVYAIDGAQVPSHGVATNIADIKGTSNSSPHSCEPANASVMIDAPVAIATKPSTADVFEIDQTRKP